MDKTLSNALPDRPIMLRAYASRDASFEGVFVTAVKTTGIFCRPTCSAKKPKPENVEFYPASRDALFAGYRPCKRCRPLEPAGAVPDWLRGLVDAIEAEPSRRVRDGDLREMGLDPARVRRWFQASHGMTFHAYSRARRLGDAMGRIRQGESVTDAAMRKLAGRAPGSTEGKAVVHVTRVTTPLGPMVVGATRTAVVLCEFADRRMLPTQFDRLGKRLDAVFVPGSNRWTKAAGKQLTEYFAGKRVDFEFPMELPGTEFQQAVWEALRAVPFGRTSTYGDLASSIGRSGAVRAVGKANGDNRMAIVVPCHRIVGTGGALVGYGGGLWRKQRLLELETRVLAERGMKPRVTRRPAAKAGHG